MEAHDGQERELHRWPCCRIPMRGRKTAANCESCMNYEYDDDYECYVCTQDLDEDEMVRFVQGDFRECPYYQVGDEYRVVRKQM